MASLPYTLGWVYNLVEEPHRSNASQIIAISIALPVIALLVVTLRLVSRWKVVHKFALDDFAVIASLLLSIAYCSISMYQTRWGLGLDPKDIPSENLDEFSKTQYSGGPVYCLATLGFKVSLLASYLRAAGFNRNYALFLYVMLALCVISQLIFTFLLSLPCNPVAKQWNPKAHGMCIDQIAVYFGLAGTSLGFDLIIIALPFPLLKRLELTLRKKIAIAVLYGLGFFVTIIQIVRIVKIRALTKYTHSESLIIWSMVEINIGVIVACLPTIAAWFKFFSRKPVYSEEPEEVDTSKMKYFGRTDTNLSPDDTIKTNGSENRGFNLDSRMRDTNTDNYDDEIELWPVRPTSEHNWAEATLASLDDSHDRQQSVASMNSNNDRPTSLEREVLPSGWNDFHPRREVKVIEINGMPFL